MPTVLDTIVAAKRAEVAEAKQNIPVAELGRAAADAPPVRDFAAALRSNRGIQLIAEVKRASPSAGVLRADFDPVAIASTYAANGAAAISVLTDSPFFHGSLEHLAAVRARVDLPVLRKDFIIDSYQIIEARRHGADAVLLIAEILPGRELADRLGEIHELGMEALVELYDASNLPRVLESRANVIGINNRDLRTFVTDLRHTIDVAPSIPEGRVLVSESGIRTREDVVRLEAAGAHAILVGETLMRSTNIGETIDALLGRRGHARSNNLERSD